MSGGGSGPLNVDDSEIVRSIKTTASNIGGNDTIIAGSGNNTILGGTGTDKITTGSGNDIIFGDEATFTYYADGSVQQLLSANEAIGSYDTIVAGDGDIIFV